MDTSGRTFDIDKKKAQLNILEQEFRKSMVRAPPKLVPAFLCPCAVWLHPF